jgi:carboxypeptidase C (cathepsin A)
MSDDRGGINFDTFTSRSRQNGERFVTYRVTNAGHLIPNDLSFSSKRWVRNLRHNHRHYQEN